MKLPIRFTGPYYSRHLLQTASDDRNPALAGPVDVLVLSGAVVHRREKATVITDQELRDAFDANVIAAFNLTKAYLKTTLLASGQKTIINISSAAGQVHTTRRVKYQHGHGGR